MPRARGACAPPRGNTDLRIAHLAFPQSPVSLARDTGLRARAGIVGARRRPRPAHPPTIRAFRPPRSLSRVSERGLWGNANVGRILAGSRRWNPAMSSRTHSPAPLHTALPTPRVPGTRFLGVRRGAEVRHLQKERRSASASVQKARLQAREWAARNVATTLRVSRPAGCQPHGRDFSQMRHLKGAPRRGLGKVSVALQVGGGVGLRFRNCKRLVAPQMRGSHAA